MTHKTAHTRSRLLDGKPGGPFDSPLNEHDPFTHLYAREGCVKAAARAYRSTRVPEPRDVKTLLAAHALVDPLSNESNLRVQLRAR